MTAALEPPLRPYLWLRRMAAGGSATLLVLAIAWPIAQHIAQRRLDATLARLRAAGVAMRITDLQPAPLEDRDNAAWYYKQAFKTISSQFDSPRNSNYEEPELGIAPRFTAFWQTLVERSEVDNATAFAFARQARGHDRADWGWTFATPAFAILLPSLNESRQLANTLCDGADRSFFIGDSAEGVERIGDTLHLAKETAQTPFLVTALVGNGIDALAVDALSPHIGTLRVGTGHGMVSREAVRALIVELLNDDGPMRRMSSSMRVEAAAILDMGRIGPAHAHVARPAMTADLARICERMLELIEAADASTNAERQQRLDAVPTPTAFPYGISSQLMGFASKILPPRIAIGRPLTHTIGSGLYARAFGTSQNAATGRDGAAIALAMRLYELDHAGAWPAKLEQLAPDYLPAIPKNKVSVDDALYAYQLIPGGLPDGRDRPILVKNGQPIVRDRIAISQSYGRGPTIELSSLARAEPPTSLPTTIPAVRPATQP